MTDERAVEALFRDAVDAATSGQAPDFYADAIRAALGPAGLALVPTERAKDAEARDMPVVRDWMGLDLWVALGHDSEDWPGWSADVWADMLADVRTRAKDAEMATALETIEAMEPEPTDELPEHTDCEECARRLKRRWPLSGMCEERYRQVAARDRSAERRYNAQGTRMRMVARDALARYREAREEGMR